MSHAATQMVAVLMTDLVGSTAIADRIGPEAAEELRTEHFGLLRGALERTGGREVKSLGDGLMVVFDGAAQSLACATQMQQAVEARNRRAEEQLGVRIVPDPYSTCLHLLHESAWALVQGDLQAAEQFTIQISRESLQASLPA